MPFMTRSSYGRLPACVAELTTVFVLAIVAALLWPAASAEAATIIVTNANDTTNTGDGVSLREAILSINAGANANADVIPTGAYGTNGAIHFNIPAASDPGCAVATGVCTIAVAAGGLPTVTRTVTIDGYSQPGASPNTNPISEGGNAALKIQLNGDGAGFGTEGLVIEAASTTVRGLVINRFLGQPGILILPAGSGSVIAGNYLGTDATGNATPSPNAISLSVGVYALNASGVTVGGTAAGDRNVISGTGFGIEVEGANATNARIQGNYIGTSASGVTRFFISYGVYIKDAPNATIGGTSAGASNLVSGNDGPGIYVQGSRATNARILGNFIGTNATGTGPLRNGTGVSIEDAPNAMIGGTTGGARNIVSGNGRGIVVQGMTATGAVIQGNYVGTSADGASAIPNYEGVVVSGAPGALVGGTEAGAGNVISGNTLYGVAAYGSATPGIPGPVIQGNHIGTNAAGTAGVPNRIGITAALVTGVTVGGTAPRAANIVAFNTRPGVRISSGTGAVIRGNSIYENGGLGIDLGGDDFSGNFSDGDGVTANDAGDGDTGPNNRQNFPVLTSASVGAGTTQVVGTLNSTPNTTFQLDFYANPSCGPSGHGEGQTYLGSATVNTDGSGNGSFTASNLTGVSTSMLISATATHPDGSTSEFSGCQVFGMPGVTVTPASALVTTEAGGTATFTARLNTIPSAPVTIPVSSSDTTEGTVSPASLAFAPNETALNPQTVTITGQNDSDVDGNVAYTIVLGAATSADPAYSGQDPPDVAATNRDDETVTCSPRPAVTVTTAKNGDGRLRVTVGATTPPSDVQNRLSQLQFDAGLNANVQIPGQAPRAGTFTYDIPNQPTSFVFFVGREGAGATHLPFRVVDGCASQPWRTFVGGGATAF
jgi:hypothetical protein